MKKVLLCGFVLFFFGVCAAQGAVVADLRGDYQEPADPFEIPGPTSAVVGIADTAGDGSWNYYRSNITDIDDPAALVILLNWDTVGNVPTTGYGSNGIILNGNAQVPAVSAHTMFDDPPAIEPETDDLIVHPGDYRNTASTLVVMRWTAGASSAGLMTIAGAVQNPEGSSTAHDAINFYVAINGEIVLTITPPSGSPTLSDTPFEVSALIAAGDTVDFIVDPRTNHKADQTYVSATISHSLKASNPTPADGAEGVLVSTALQWTTGQDPANPGFPNPSITHHKVWMGEAPEALTLKTTLPVGTTNYAAALAKDKTYYWRIDEVTGDPNDIEGFLWSFSTELSLPQIIQQPVDTLVMPGNSAVLTVVAENPLEGPMIYQWYRDPDPAVSNDEIALTNGTEYSGVNTPELTVLNVNVADEAFYFCEISNIYLKQSDRVMVMVARELYYWPFNGDAVEAHGSGYNGTSTGTVVIGTTNGIDGGAAAPDGTAGLTFGHVPVAYPGTGQFSISYWVLPNFNDVDRPHFMKYDETGGRGFYVGGDNNYLDFYGNIWTPNVQAVTAGTAMSATEWTHLVMTYDGDALKIYVNGVLVASNEGLNYDYVDYDVEFAMAMQLAPTVADRLFSGKIDDARIFNYAISPVTIAGLYTDLAGGSICAAPPAMDLNGDCVVDMYEFAALAAAWLDCGLVPDCITP